MDKPIPLPSEPPPPQAPPSRAALLPVLALIVAVTIGLGFAFGFVRATIAVLIFLGIFVFGARQIRSMVSIPPEPELADVSDYGLKYVCRMCGLELKVEVAAKDKAPTHCMEPMELVRTGGKPPLRSID